MKIERKLQKTIEKSLFKGELIVIYGARQVGKTTLVREIERKFSSDSRYLNCDEPDVRQALTDKTSTELREFLGNKKIIILDEAQRVRNIGITLKLLADNFPETQIIATGSSSFELSNEISEPLTGRKKEFLLHPFSLDELGSVYSSLEISRVLERRIVFGMYPSVALDKENAAAKLKEITRSYLYKDILQYENIRNPEVLEKLLQALALQLGNEVSYNELAGLVGVDKRTAANYVQILEKAFIIFRLRPFSRNLRNELKKLRKIYFYDTGVRNALINNLNPMNLRQDAGALWENFILSERIKFNENSGRDANMYFWRTLQGHEIDYLEEEGGKISGYEFKWEKDKFKKPKDFLKAYSQSSVELVNRKNFWKFLGL